jgi:hypothetical protein
MDSFNMRENFGKFMQILKNNITDITTFEICCLFKDVLLENYVYKPNLTHYNQVTHMWEHRLTRETISINQIRKICKEIRYKLLNIQNEFLQNLDDSTLENETNNTRKIKHIAELCIYIHSGDLYKEFIDCFRKGYL